MRFSAVVCGSVRTICRFFLALLPHVAIDLILQSSVESCVVRKKNGRVDWVLGQDAVLDCLNSASAAQPFPFQRDARAQAVFFMYAMMQ